MVEIYLCSFQKGLNSFNYMRYISFLVFFCLSSIVASGFPTASPDSLKLASLNSKLEEYFSAMESEELDVQIQECDYIISATEDSLIRQTVAEKVFDYYRTSKRMGAESVAIHVFDKWFASGLVKMKDESEFLNARIYADFNRQSLIGNPAPELKLQTFEGDSLDIYSRRDERYKVLYFYDLNCALCRVQTLLLRNLMTTTDYPIDLYAVYTGDDKEGWGRYIAEKFDFSQGAKNPVHLWDETLNSDFQRKYGVVSTPKIFLIAPDGTILGRGLDVPALSQLIEIILKRQNLVYGSEASASLFESVFSQMSLPLHKDDVRAVADHIAASTISRDDTLMFRQMTGDLLYYLSSQRGEAYKEGLKYLVDEHILSKPEIWKSQDDSLKIVGMAELFGDLLSKALPGSELPSINVLGVLCHHRGCRKVSLDISRLNAKRNIILFYTEGCALCAQEKMAVEAAFMSQSKEEMSREERRTLRNTKVFMVNIDEIANEDKQLSISLFDSFDLASLPYIIESDKNAVITHRYISMLK